MTATAAPETNITTTLATPSPAATGTATYPTQTVTIPLTTAASVASSTTATAVSETNITTTPTTPSPIATGTATYPTQTATNPLTVAASVVSSMTATAAPETNITTTPTTSSIAASRTTAGSAVTPSSSPVTTTATPSTPAATTAATSTTTVQTSTTTTRLTTASTTVTTQSATTSSTAKPPQPTTPAGSKPVELDKVHLPMPFIIRFLADKFPDGLDDTTSAVFILYRDNFIAQINKIYLKCPGFDSTRTQVTRFRPGSIDVDYIINIISKAALNNAPEISAFMTNNETLGGLINMTLGNFTVDRSFVESNLSKQLITQAQGVQTFANDPCNPNDARKMCAICSKCFYSIELANPVSCSPLCPDKGQTCSTDEQLNVANCICAPYYLLMAGNCVHQDIIIGVFAGVGGALVIGLILALVIVRWTRSGKSTKDKESKKPSEHSDEVDLPSGGYELNIISPKQPDKECEDTEHTQPQQRRDDDATSSGSTEIDTVPEEIKNMTVYKRFKPQLQNIDQFEPIHIERPQLKRSTSDIKLGFASDWSDEDKRYF